MTQRLQIVPGIVHDRVHDRSEQDGDRVRDVLQSTEAVLQLLRDPGVHIRLRLPQGKGDVLPGVRVRYVEHIPQVRLILRGVDQGDALGTPVHPAMQTLVPQPDLRTGGCLRFLSMDQELIPKRILVEPGSGIQKRLPAFRRPGDGTGGVNGKSRNPFQFCQLPFLLSFHIVC